MQAARDEIEHPVESVFSHAWESCVMGSWYKWPNPRRPDIVHVDLLNKRFCPDSNCFFSTRLLILRLSSLPKWLNRLLGIDHGFFVEESILCPDRRLFVMKGRNLSFASILQMEETCVYEPSLDNDAHTLLRQNARARLKAFGWASSRVEKMAVENYKENSSLGREILIETIEKRNL